MAKKVLIKKTNNNPKEALIATTNDIQKYVEISCIVAYPRFEQEFKSSALDDRPFVNYFLYGLNGDVISIHDNYSVLDSDYYGTENTLDAMVDNYLTKGILGTTIRFVKPPLIITDVVSKADVENAFQQAGYATFKEIPRR